MDYIWGYTLIITSQFSFVGYLGLTISLQITQPNIWGVISHCGKWTNSGGIKKGYHPGIKRGWLENPLQLEVLMGQSSK